VETSFKAFACSAQQTLESVSVSLTPSCDAIFCFDNNLMGLPDLAKQEQHFLPPCHSVVCWLYFTLVPLTLLEIVVVGKGVHNF